ncbi:MAG: hypothetical protein OXC65_03225 [Thiotrichales bacterium]|nr:hypothetical protein [Thiotrichales bacterium]
MDRNPGVNTFSYTSEILDGLEIALSRDRLSTYLDATGWSSPTTRTWIEHHSRVSAVLEASWDASGIRF